MTQLRIRQAFLTSLAVLLTVGLVWAESARAATPLDRAIAADNQGKSNLTVVPVIDDLAYLRRVTVDLIGRIPTDKEIQQYLRWSPSERRGKVVDKLMDDARFADRWTVFFADMLRIRTRATGGQQLLAYVHKAVRDDKPYDELAHELISANGKSSVTPAVGFVLGDNAEPMALAGATAQTFMGIRIACAECHDHPFDEWTQKQFYGFAAYFGKTRRVQSRFSRSIYTTEGKEMTVLWPPERQKPESRSPVEPKFPFELISYKQTPSHIARLEAKRRAIAAREAGKVSAEAGVDIDDLVDSANATVDRKRGDFDVAAEAKRDLRKINTQADLYTESQLRQRLAELVTDPRNRYFSQSFVNRVWNEMMGRGFVNPIDDFSNENPPSHPKALAHLADEFIASGYSLKSLVKLIVTSDTYSRGHLSADVSNKVRMASENAFTATPIRRMISEVLYDSVVVAGHLEELKWNKGENVRTFRERIRVIIGEEKVENEPEAPKLPASVTGATGDNAMANKMANGQKPGKGYDLEKSVEIDFDKALMAKDDEPQIQMMAVKSKEQIEAERMAAEAAMRRQRTRYQYTYKWREYQRDDNPQYGTSMRMATPAPRPHFLRVFGQPGREELGDFREHAPSMRQALMMLNGKLTHEASRVGTLEPMHRLMVGPKANLDAAIKLAYREIYTREPNAAEVAEAKAIIKDADSDLEGMADLRWVMLNSHEFRYLP